MVGEWGPRAKPLLSSTLQLLCSTIALASCRASVRPYVGRCVCVCHRNAMIKINTSESNGMDKNEWWNLQQKTRGPVLSRFLYIIFINLAWFARWGRGSGAPVPPPLASERKREGRTEERIGERERRRGKPAGVGSIPSNWFWFLIDLFRGKTASSSAQLIENEIENCNVKKRRRNRLNRNNSREQGYILKGSQI